MMGQLQVLRSELRTTFLELVNDQAQFLKTVREALESDPRSVAFVTQLMKKREEHLETVRQKIWETWK